MNASVKPQGFFARHTAAFTQAVIWLLLLMLPLFMASEGQRLSILLTWLVPISAWMLLFYTNYILLIRRFLFRHRPWTFAGLNILLWLAVSWLLTAIDIFLEDEGLTVTFSELFKASLVLFGVTGLFLVLAAVSFRSMQRNHKLEQQKERAEKEASEQELNRLKSQLNPHFLFNSLNNIAALSAFDPERTQGAIATLSSMLRYVLYDTASPLVSLDAEEQFLRDYCSLMRLRYTDSLQLKFTGAFPSGEGLRVPPMLFISLVENAFKYGASSTHPSEIIIDTRVSDDRRELTMSISNTLLIPTASAPAEKVRPEKHGVGLKNLRARLEILYPGCHELTFGTADGLYRATIKIPLDHGEN